MGYFSSFYVSYIIVFIKKYSYSLYLSVMFDTVLYWNYHLSGFYICLTSGRFIGL